MSEDEKSPFFEEDPELEKYVFTENDPTLDKVPKRAEPPPPRPKPRSRSSQVQADKWIPGKPTKKKRKWNFSLAFYAIMLVVTLGIIYLLVTNVMSLYLF